MKLSLCMIVKNEENTLPRALANARIFADEIVVTDTGSTDGTVRVAKELADAVYDFKWIDDFSAARNYCIARAHGDYWMWLDADDVVENDTAKSIARLKSRLACDIVMLPYVTDTDENGGALFEYYRERIIKNRSDYKFFGNVHEVVPLYGKIEKKPYRILHAKSQIKDSTRNLRIYEQLKSTRQLDARESYYYARELYYHREYVKAINMFMQFIADPGGFYVNKIDACLCLSRCYTAINQKDLAIAALYNSFAYGLPNGEVCCELGLKYFAEGDYERAAYWFDTALRAKPDKQSGAFVQSDCYDFLPSIWLSVCYDKTGNAKKALKYHERAKKLRPNHPSVIANDAYFNGN